MSDAVVAVILAGGLGTRIRHLLADLPKPMAPVAGRPFIEWIVRFLVKQGMHEFVLSTGYRADAIRTHFEQAKIPGAAVRCIPETEPIGTAGGFIHAAMATGLQAQRWLVLNGDSIVLTSLRPLLEAANDQTVDGALLGLQVPDTSRYGSLAWDHDNCLTGFVEKRPGRGTISAGIYLFSNRMLAEFPAERPLSFERQVFPLWIQKGHKMKVVPVSAPFLDIGTEETLAQAEVFVRSQPGFYS